MNFIWYCYDEMVSARQCQCDKTVEDQDMDE